MTEDPKWTEWMNYSEKEGRYPRLFMAEQEQLEIEDGENCQMIYVRGTLVGAVDAGTEVQLRLSSENSPALSFRKRNTNLFVMVFLHEWKR
jgi:hypothetical protein